MFLSRRRAARRKGNKVAPQATTDDYDSTDHAPHPYHMMLDPRSERKLLASRTSSRQKQGRSQRGRPFSREQSHLTTSGRRSRAIGRDVQRELAWMETPGGVQLMRIQVCVCVGTTESLVVCKCTCIGFCGKSAM